MVFAHKTSQNLSQEDILRYALWQSGVFPVRDAEDPGVTEVLKPLRWALRSVTAQILIMMTLPFISSASSYNEAHDQLVEAFQELINNGRAVNFADGTPSSTRDGKEIADSYINAIVDCTRYLIAKYGEAGRIPGWSRQTPPGR